MSILEDLDYSYDVILRNYKSLGAVKFLMDSAGGSSFAHHAEIPHMKLFEIIAALLNKDVLPFFSNGVALGFKTDLIDSALQKIINIAKKLKENVNLAEEKELIDVFLNYPLPVLFRDSYNDPTTSDIQFKIGEETLYLHRALLSLDPVFQAYLKRKPHQIIHIQDENEGNLLKQKIDLLYRPKFKDFSQTLPRNSNKSLFNNNKAYPDFKIVCGKEEILVHKAILVSTFPRYFKPIVNNNMSENQKGRVEYTQDEFEGVKAILEYAYTGQKPDLDEESAKNFNALLSYFNPDLLSPFNFHGYNFNDATNPIKL